MPTAINPNNFPTLNPDRIPEYAQHEIAKTAIHTIHRFYEQPGVQQRFEAWQAERARQRGEIPAEFPPAEGN